MINTTTEELEKSDNKIHPAGQFLSFALISFGFIVVATIAALVIAVAIYGINSLTAISSKNFTAPHTVTVLWIAQIIGMTLPIFAAPVFFAYVIVKDPQDYLKPTIRFPWVLMILVFCIMFISSPLIELLGNINAKMVLPHFLDSLQKWMRESEDNNEKLLKAMLQMNSLGAMLLDVLVIGLLTGIAEEFMFRGVIQTIFMRWTKNKHAAIWITAILFSAFHFEFFGFLPRLLLGALFGYFVAWSGSIWPAVWGHFINNGTAVVATYLYQHKKTTLNLDDQHLFNAQLYIFSFVTVGFLMYVYRYINLNKKPLLIF